MPEYIYIIIYTHIYMCVCTFVYKYKRCAIAYYNRKYIEYICWRQLLPVPITIIEQEVDLT